MAKWPLKRAAEEYFTWKLANSSEATVEREKRIFKPVEKFFASDFRVNAITLTRNLLVRAHALGATEPQHYLLPLRLVKSNSPRDPNRKFDVNRPMTRWVRGWRKLTEKSGMAGFRFHDLRHTFRTLGTEAGVPLEVMMAQLGHMDRETSLE
jgi:hypothetical protein